MNHYSVPKFYLIEKEKTWFYLQYTGILHTRAIIFQTDSVSFRGRQCLSDRRGLCAGVDAVSGKPHFSFSIRDPEIQKGAVIWTSSFNTAAQTRRIAVCTRLIRLF